MRKLTQNQCINIGTSLQARFPLWDSNPDLLPFRRAFPLRDSNPRGIGTHIISLSIPLSIVNKIENPQHNNEQMCSQHPDIFLLLGTMASCLSSRQLTAKMSCFVSLIFFVCNQTKAKRNRKCITFRVVFPHRIQM